MLLVALEWMDGGGPNNQNILRLHIVGGKIIIRKKLNKHELLINGFEWKTERATVNLVTLLGMYMGMEVGSFLGEKCARENQ